MKAHRWLVAALALAGCGGDSATTEVVPPANPVPPPSVALANGPQAATVGSPFSYDASRGGTVFTDPRGQGLTYTVTFTPAANGLAATGALISGTPAAPGVVVASITARDGSGATVSTAFRIVAFSAGLPTPNLPVALLAYADARVPLPAHFLNPQPPPPGQPPPPPGPIGQDNTPAGNVTSDAGATLGRVLFYDTRLSANDRTACASCHLQSAGFSDTARLSRGFAGGVTGRHSMGLANARFYQNGRAFWDERAMSLEVQALMPIQDATEMGLSLPDLEAKLTVTPFYPALFTAAFGTPEVTSDRIGRALAQFVRSLTSYRSRFDAAFAPGAPPNFAAVLTPQELEGLQLFGGAPAPPGTPVAGCNRCHSNVAQIAPGTRNNGLDANTSADQGAGGGRFKSPSLRNVAVRAPYMHDGRFATLREVVEFYNSGVQAHPNLDPGMRAPDGSPARLGLTAAQVDAVVAFLRALTDTAFLTDPRLGNPFP